MTSRYLHFCIIGLTASFLTPALAGGAPEISHLEIKQAMVLKDQVYQVTPALKISFELAAPSDVTVQISRHLASYFQFKWPYLAEPTLVRTLPLGPLAAGVHTIDWDGMDEQGKPVVESHNLSAAFLNAAVPKPTTPNQLMETVPVNFLQVKVKTNADQLSANFERGENFLGPNRTTLPFMKATLDSENHFLIPAFIAWSVYRYTPDFVSEPGIFWPRTNRGNGTAPTECREVHVDSHGHVLVMNTAGIYRFDDKGIAVTWPNEKADYVWNNGYVLGNRDPAKSADPGFAISYNGFAIDDKDTIYLARTAPDNCIHVFDDNGTFLRKLALPPGKSAANIAWAGNGTLAVAANDSLLFLDSTTGAVKKTITEVAPVFVQADKDGNIYAGPSLRDLWRYTPTGDPLPFNPALPNVKGNHLQLFLGDMAKHGQGAAGFSPGGIWGFAFSPDGSFYTSEPPPPYYDATTMVNLLHYAKDGTFLPDMLGVKWGCQVPSNVYLDHLPATMEIIVSNFAPNAQPFTINWTLTNFEGKRTSGVATLTADPMCRQNMSFTVDAPEMGHYRLEADIRQDGKFVEKLQAQLARIPSRPIFADRYSPFAVAWVGEYEVMALAGAKSHRGDSVSWASQIEPVEGVFYPNHPDVPQWQRGGGDSLRAFARKWGFYNLNGLDYGENWFGDSMIYNFDRFYDFCQHVLNLFAGKGEAFYQFWNEPDNYWHREASDPFAREQFVVVQAHLWSMIKASDKNASSIGDGNAGNMQVMQDFVDYGATGFTDSVQIHYPAATVFSYNNMTFPDLPETKVPVMKKLVDLRNKFYPGKEVWNTEENIPANPLTPEMAATNLPRVEIPQIAAGVDKIYQFSQTAVEGMTLHDVTAFLDEYGQPFPTYVSYATMTSMIDGTVYSGQADLGTGAYGYLFARKKDFILAANCVSGTVDSVIDAGAPRVTVTDTMGRTREVATENGKLKLTLSTQMQYVSLPRQGGASKIAHDELARELGDLQITNAAEIPAQIDLAAKTAATDLAAMNRLYHLVKAAEVAAAASESPGGGTATTAALARQATETREDADGYLRQTRVALGWAEHLAQIAANDSTMAWPASLAAHATEILAATEVACYPGAAINAYNRRARGNRQNSRDRSGGQQIGNGNRQSVPLPDRSEAGRLLRTGADGLRLLPS